MPSPASTRRVTLRQVPWRSSRPYGWWRSLPGRLRNRSRTPSRLNPTQITVHQTVCLFVPTSVRPKSSSGVMPPGGHVIQEGLRCSPSSDEAYGGPHRPRHLSLWWLVLPALEESLVILQLSSFNRSPFHLVPGPTTPWTSSPVPHHWMGTPQL